MDRTSAATDVLVGLVALAGVVELSRLGRRPPFKARVWSGVFGLLALAAALGAVSHGLVLPKAVNDFLWHPLYLALGLTVALFGVGVIHDLGGARAARRALPAMAAVGVGFYLHRWLTSGSFLAFIGYEAIVIGAALLAYATLAMRRQLAGAGMMTAGILFTLAAALVQSSPTASARIVWEFDHNGLFHLLQVPGLIFLILGLRRSLASDGP